MAFRSNFDDLKKSLDELGQAFAVDRMVSNSRRMGDELIDIVARVIEDRTRNRHLEPDGTPMAQLKHSTIKRKLRKGFPPVLGVETGMMLDFSEIRGKTHVKEDSIEMEYGLGIDTEDKAEWFQEGRSGAQEKRPFYELGEEGEKAVDDYIDEVAEAAKQRFEED